MALLDRIANYFKEWDGIDETAPKMELNIHELKYIANMNVERCRLIRQLNEANLKTEALLLDKTQEIRAKAIDDAIDEAAKAICIGCGYLKGHECTYKGANCGVSKPMLEVVVKALEQMKAGD